MFEDTVIKGLDELNAYILDKVRNSDDVFEATIFDEFMDKVVNLVEFINVNVAFEAVRLDDARLLSEAFEAAKLEEFINGAVRLIKEAFDAVKLEEFINDAARLEVANMFIDALEEFINVSDAFEAARLEVANMFIEAFEAVKLEEFINGTFAL